MFAYDIGKFTHNMAHFQLKHVLTGKFVHMSTTQTSKIDKNYMKVSLHEFNSKNAQFRILPRYKVKSEGEVVSSSMV